MQINVLENRKGGGQKWIIQRHWRHRAHKVQAEENQNKKHNASQKPEHTRNMGPNNNRG